MKLEIHEGNDDSNIVIVQVSQSDSGEKVLKIWLEQDNTTGYPSSPPNEQLLAQLQKADEAIMIDLQSLRDAVAEERTVEDSIVVLLDGVAKQLADQITNDQVDRGELQAIVDQVRQNSRQLATAVSRNTPADPNPQPPQPTTDSNAPTDPNATPTDPNATPVDPNAPTPTDTTTPTDPNAPTPTPTDPNAPQPTDPTDPNAPTPAPPDPNSDQATSAPPTDGGPEVPQNAAPVDAGLPAGDSTPPTPPLPASPV